MRGKEGKSDGERGEEVRGTRGESEGSDGRK